MKQQTTEVAAAADKGSQQPPEVAAAAPKGLQQPFKGSKRPSVPAVAQQPLVKSEAFFKIRRIQDDMVNRQDFHKPPPFSPQTVFADIVPTAET